MRNYILVSLFPPLFSLQVFRRLLNRHIPSQSLLHFSDTKEPSWVLADMVTWNFCALVIFCQDLSLRLSFWRYTRVPLRPRISNVMVTFLPQVSGHDGHDLWHSISVLSPLDIFLILPSLFLPYLHSECSYLLVLLLSILCFLHSRFLFFYFVSMVE